VSSETQPIYEDGGESPASVAQDTIHGRFRDLLTRNRNSGQAVAWKEALLEPPNPLKAKQRAPLKLPVLFVLCITGLSIGGFLWFSLSH
jgi:hypothetical protein